MPHSAKVEPGLFRRGSRRPHKPIVQIEVPPEAFLSVLKIGE